MSTEKPHLYINSKGYLVTRHSYSGSESFKDCARKYYLERVQGWAEKTENAAKFFGIALEHAITFWHQHRQDTPGAVADFVRGWAEHKDKPYKYPKTDGDWNKLNLTGQELVKLYTFRYPTFPYVVNNPLDFQVETTFELFPGTELAGLEFTSYIDLVAQVKSGLAREQYALFSPGTPIIIDMKTSGKDIPHLVVLDPQLRSYSWVKQWTNVAFLWFRKTGRTISKGDTVTLLESYAGLQPGDDALVLTTDDFGLWLTQDPQVAITMDEKFVGKSKTVEAARQAYIEANSKFAPETVVTKQRIQFKAAVISAESAADIGQSIRQDAVNIVNATKTGTFPMQSGVRYPHEKCPNCAMRGICSNDQKLQDLLIFRKQKDELDFGEESE